MHCKRKRKRSERKGSCKDGSVVPCRVVSCRVFISSTAVVRQAILGTLHTPSPVVYKVSPSRSCSASASPSFLPPPITSASLAAAAQGRPALLQSSRPLAPRTNPMHSDKERSLLTALTSDAGRGRPPSPSCCNADSRCCLFSLDVALLTAASALTPRLILGSFNPPSSTDHCIEPLHARMDGCMDGHTADVRITGQ